MTYSKLIQTASHWGVYNVEMLADGSMGAVSPFERDTDPSPLIAGLPELARGSLRIDQPYIRSGYLRQRTTEGRGGDTFVAVTWQVALTLIEEELKRIKSQFGNEAIYGGSYGWASAGRLHHSPSILKRFLGLFGGYVDKIGNHSFGAALGMMPYVIGRGDINNMTAAWPTIINNTRLVVMFGGGHTKNNQIDAGGAVVHENLDWSRKAMAANVEFVNISPSKHDTPDHVNSQWIGIRPNTDIALMLGLAHTLVAEDLHDRAFIDRYCHGYDKFEDYLLGKEDGQPKNSIWAARITGVDASVIERLARRMNCVRTLVTTSWSVQRADHGEQPVWMTVVLAALLGQIGLPGGGFAFGFGATNSMLAQRLKSVPRPTLPLGSNAVKIHVPVGRVTDMLLNPGSDLEYNGRLLKMPNIRLIYSIGGNPFHHNSNLNRFLRGWKQPETIIVHEPWWNPAAKHADIVLPATTTLERNDILAAEASRFMIAMKKVMDPVAAARNDFDIFSELSDRLNIKTQFTESRDEMGWLRHMYETARSGAGMRDYSLPDFDKFWSDGFYEFPIPTESDIFLGAYRLDPTKNSLKTPSGRIELYSDTINEFKYNDCPPHPAWLEPAEWLGAPKARVFPIHLLSNQPKNRLHSQLDPTILSRSTKIREREPIQICRSDAANRGIQDDDIVRVYNDRGAFLAGAVLVDHLVPGTALISTGAWFDPEVPGLAGSLEKHGNPNVVTLDKGTSRLTQSSVAQTALVDIQVVSNPPSVTAFSLPVFE